MKKVRASVGEGALVSWVNEAGERVAVPLIRIEGEWKQVGSYLKYGTSKSDPAFAAVFPLPYKWRPSKRILRAIRRSL